MFAYASSFNQPLNAWRVDLVTTMRYMFYRAFAFNQPLDGWQVGRVIDMYAMFYSASKFNQNLCPWISTLNFPNVQAMFTKSGCANKTSPNGPPGPFCAEKNK